MLIKLLPDQISNFWDIIKYGIQQSLPPVAGEGPDKMNKIFTSLLSGKAQCWASYENTNNGKRFEGIVVTRILYDDVSDTRSLLVYCLYGYDRIDNKSWRDGLKVLIKWAASRNCNRIIAYTSVPEILKLVQRLGGSTEYRFISIPLMNNSTKVGG